MPGNGQPEGNKKKKNEKTKKRKEIQTERGCQIYVQLADGKNVFKPFDGCQGG